MKQGSGAEMKRLLIGVLAIVVFAMGIVMTGLITNSSKITSTKVGKTLENYDEGNVEGNTEGNNEKAEERGKVTIKYLDSNGEQLSADEEIEGVIGTEYQTTRKDISHYRSNGSEPINKAGNFRKENITVTYVYELVSESIDVESQNNLITVKVENEYPSREYKLKLEQKSTEGISLTGGKFSLIDNKDDSKLVDGMTTNGALTLGVINVNNEVNEEYDLVENQAPKGYLKALGDTNFTIQLIKTYNTETKRYELQATSQDNRLEIVEDSQNDEIIIKVANEKKKTYELATKQFASSVDGTATSRNITAVVNNEGDIVYNETEEDVVVRDFEKVIYTIRIYNEGNQDMTAGIVTEELPAGLKFLTDSQINQDYGWTLSDGKLTTNHIQNTTIEGIDSSSQTQVDYEELKLEVEVEEEKAGQSNNLESKVSVVVDEREENQDNNEYTETVILDRIPANYDLAVKKFASKINGTDTGRGVTASVNELNQIVYEENNENKTIADGQTVVYTIRVYNEGNRDLNGTKVTEILPNGLTLVSNSEINEEYGWEEVEGKIQTTYLENKTIEKVRTYRGEVPQYEDIQIELTLNEENIDNNTTFIVNEVKIAKAENETDELDNSDIDSILLGKVSLTNDFALKLFASKINGIDTGRSVSASISEGEILYTKNNPQKTVKDGEKIVYTIRVYNEGIGEIDGTKLTDVIPAGLKFVEESEINEEYGWTKNANNAETTYLEDKTIQGLNMQTDDAPKYIDVKIELEVVKDEMGSNQTQLKNKVIIAKAENEIDVTDNEDQDTVDLYKEDNKNNLVIKKFASKIDNENTGRNVEASLTEQNEILYTRTIVEKEVEEGQKVTYTFRVFNEGSENLQGTKITENLPAGLKFVENSTINTQYGWEEVEGKLETTYLENKTINGVKVEEGQVPNYEEVLLELEVTRQGLGSDSVAIQNTVTLAKHNLETNIQDNTDKDTIILGKIPNYNLSVSKFVSKIDGTSTQEQVTVTKNTNGEFTYTKPSTRQKVKDKQKITYTYRIFNTGNEIITGTQLEEEIPQGLKYIEESQVNQTYGWARENNKLTTQYLVGKTIDTYDSGKANYKDVEIEFEVVEDGVPTDNLIINTIKVAKNDNETDTTDNEDTQIIELKRTPKTYDVIMKKFVYSLDGKQLDKEITANVNDNGEIVFKNDNTKTSVNKGQTVVFTLRMFNIGNQKMTGNVVTDTIPKGLEYVENSAINAQYNWNVQNSIATTNYLEGQTIEGFDIENNETPKYAEVKIECRVTGEDKKAHDSIINTAKMLETENDQNPDNNEDNTELVLEPEEQKVSDLSMKKFIYSVDGKRILKREVEAVNKNGKIIYTSNENIYEASNNQKIVYTLRVYNLGNGEAQGREVIEKLPAGLEFIKDSEINIENGWKMYKKDASGKLVETKKIEEATTIKTDKLVTKTIPGFKVENNETPKYQDVRIEVVVKENEVKSKDRVIKNVAKVSKLRTEKDSDNDKAEEKLKIKKFDLNVTKYIKQIMVADKDGEIVTPVGIEKRDQIIKKEVHKKKLNETEIYVTYGLKVKNIGEIAGYATKITDYIPANFELVGQDYGWKVNGNVVTTDVLANQLIKPDEYKTVEVTFRWKLSDGELGLRNNKAIISNYKNDYDAKDNTPDRENESKMIVSIKTGEDQVIAGIILAILMIIASAICIKLNKQNKK